MFHDRREIHRHVADPHAEPAGRSRLRGGAGGAQQRLGRHAAGDEAVAAEQVALDQGDAGAESGRPGGRDQSGRPAADDQQVVARRRFGVDPVGRVDGVQQHPIPVVRRRNDPSLGHTVLRRHGRLRVVHRLQRPVQRPPRLPRHEPRDDDGGGQADPPERLPRRARVRRFPADRRGGRAQRRADVDVEQRPRQHAEPRRQDVVAQFNPGQSEGVVEQDERQQRRQSGEQNNLEAALGDGRVERPEERTFGHARLDPAAGESAAQEEGARRRHGAAGGNGDRRGDDIVEPAGGDGEQDRRRKGEQCGRQVSRGQDDQPPDAEAVDPSERRPKSVAEEPCGDGPGDGQGGEQEQADDRGFLHGGSNVRLNIGGGLRDDKALPRTARGKQTRSFPLPPLPPPDKPNLACYDR